MYCEWPEFRRCCLCLPLRKGILVFGYLNVVLTILQIAVLYMIEVDELNLVPLRTVYFELPVIFNTILCAAEIVCSIILIYGIHTKRPSFVKVYYYFTISMLLASVVLEILCSVMSKSDFPWIIYFILCSMINLYLLFMVRSLIFKLQVSDGNKFNNQLSDFVEGDPVHNRVYTEIVLPKHTNTV